MFGFRGRINCEGDAMMPSLTGLGVKRVRTMDASVRIFVKWKVTSRAYKLANAKLFSLPVAQSSRM